MRLGAGSFIVRFAFDAGLPRERAVALPLDRSGREGDRECHYTRDYEVPEWDITI
jgi:hypothetical protein